MLDDRPADPTPEQLSELGLDPADLASFGEEDDDTPVGTEDQLGDQEATLAAAAAPDPDHPPIPGAPAGEPAASSSAATPDKPALPAAQAPKPGQPSGPRTEEQPSAPAGTPPPGSAASAPNAAAPPAQPFTFAAAGQRFPIDGATVDAEGEVRIPSAGYRQLVSRLGAAWSERERAFQDHIRTLDPSTNRDVVLSRLLSQQMEEAARKGPDALWEYVQTFDAQLPLLRERARRVELEAENTRYRESRQVSDRATQEQHLEPVLQESLGAQLDRYLGQAGYAELAPERDRLAARLWTLRGEGLFKLADRDYPEYGLAKGAPYLDTTVLERELGFARELLAGRQKATRETAGREAAAARNAAAMGTVAVPPTPGVTGAAVAAEPTPTDARPKTREEWVDRMSRIANSPSR